MEEEIVPVTSLSIFVPDQSFAVSETRVGPESFSFNDLGQPVPHFRSENYALRPEVIESYFYLWKITGNEMYRDWAWDAAQVCWSCPLSKSVRDPDEWSREAEETRSSYVESERKVTLNLIRTGDMNTKHPKANQTVRRCDDVTATDRPSPEAWDKLDFWIFKFSGFPKLV